MEITTQNSSTSNQSFSIYNLAEKLVSGALVVKKFIEESYFFVKCKDITNSFISSLNGRVSFLGKIILLGCFLSVISLIIFLIVVYKTVLQINILFLISLGIGIGFVGFLLVYYLIDKFLKPTEREENISGDTNLNIQTPGSDSSALSTPQKKTNAKYEFFTPQNVVDAHRGFQIHPTDLNAIYNSYPSPSTPPTSPRSDSDDERD